MYDFTSGIWLHHSGILGASPDGFVQGDFSGSVHQQKKGQPLYSPDIIEVKCPFTARDMTVKEALNSIKDFYLGNNDHTWFNTCNFYPVHLIVVLGGIVVQG